MNKPRILFFDIETMSNKIYAWGVYEQNAIEVLEHWYMLSFAWKWLGEKKTYCMTLPDFGLYKTDKHNDRDLVKFFHDVMSTADVVVGHNSNKFDKME